MLDPETHELLPRARELLRELEAGDRFKLELPASQLEIVTEPQREVTALRAQLLESRRELARALEGSALLAGSGVHPHSAGTGELNPLQRYMSTVDQYGAVAERQLVCALQVHVAVGDPELALSVYNAARSDLPALAALAANAPFYEGRDSGLASVRPLISGLLPRQGVPPAIGSWEEYEATLRWGATGGAFEPRTWWWELRPHPGYGTLEFRVPDAQSSVADAVAIAAVVQALVATLSERARAGEPLAAAPRWRIEENRWAACRGGVEGTMLDLKTGERVPTREHLHALLEDIASAASALGADGALVHARAMAEVNGAMAQRRVAQADGIRAVAPWLAGRLLQSEDG